MNIIAKQFAQNLYKTTKFQSLYQKKFLQNFSSLHALHALGPLDGRYEKKILQLKDQFSEHALIRARVKVEIEWLKFLIQKQMVTNEKGEIVKISPLVTTHLDQIHQQFDSESSQRVKDIEKVTNHDVKAVEYFIKEKLDQLDDLHLIKEYVHFCCTSEDISNLSYALLLKEAQSVLVQQDLLKLQTKMINFSEKYAEVPMIGRTHGQVASPTTLGKEVGNFTYRVSRQMKQLQKHKFQAKLNGAVGNFNAHMYAYPEYDWPQLSRQFIEQNLGLEYNPYTTQIEPHDSVCEFYNSFNLLNTILLGFSRDMWNYISIGYFKQKTKKQEVGSSTMPHKVNPIDFENCEGNIGIANSLMRHFSEKLPISRYQRDLSDSTVMRNNGLAFGYSVVAYKSLCAGLDKLEANPEKMSQDLENHWEILGEPIQTVMRKYNLESPYEILKDLTRGKGKIYKEDLHKLINESKLPDSEKQRLLQLTPSTYIGNANTMAHVSKFI